MDESNLTCDKRFGADGILQTVETRRAYRELVISTPGLSECASGVILYDETIRQNWADGVSLVKAIQDADIAPGITVDAGAKDFAGNACEKITEGLDGLRERLREYFEMGARFARWRAVIPIGEGRPSDASVEANALARYAALYQVAGQPAVKIWAGDDKNKSSAQTALLHRARCNLLARQGRYTCATEAIGA